jgi:hypothetical protein
MSTIYNMSYLSFLLSTIVFIIITVPIGVIIFEFFGLSFADYGNYLMWFVALALFNAILPVSQKSIFTT